MAKKEWRDRGRKDRETIGHDGETEGWKDGGVEGWKDGRMEGWDCIWRGQTPKGPSDGKAMVPGVGV